MADEPENPEDEDGEGKPEKKGGSPLPFIVVGILGTALGLAVPFLFPSSAGETDKAPEIIEKEKHVGADVKKVYVEFDEDPTVQNLKGNELTRYLSIKLSLVVAEDSKDAIEKDLDHKKVEMKNWLIGQIADKTLDDVGGREGQNRLRREIRDQFNSIMFPDGQDRIFDIYFDEFAVQ
jgi:flagellar FliL protein